MHPFVNDEKIHEVLKSIKENDGFPGTLTASVRDVILDKWATVEVSQETGMDIQWTLTADGKKHLRLLNGLKRWRAKNKNTWRKSEYIPNTPVPLTIDVLDALKSIREVGHPNTEKIEILARIQRSSAHGAKTILNGREYITVYGALAIFKDGVWTLTDSGKRIEAGHIRKSECAQFFGKVR